MLFGDLLEDLPFFRHNQVFNKGENWLAALTSIAILKTQNYWSRDRHLH